VDPAGTGWRSVAGVLAGAVIVSLVALVLRLADFHHEPTSDELYHLLAARSLVESGTFAILDGEYTRASLFTRLIAVSHAVTNGDIDSIRLLCIGVGTIFVFSVFAGVARIAGTAEAWVAGIMLALLPVAIYLSQFIRFYTLHALLFWLASIFLYCAVEPARSHRSRASLLVLSGALFIPAAHLQRTTVVGLLALGAWLAIALLPQLRELFPRLSAGARRRLLVVTILVAVAVGMLMAEPVEDLVDDYLSYSLWSADTHASYYILRMRDQFGLFWALFPLAAIHALIVNRRPALFGVVVFTICIALHSFAGMRSERYLFYAIPFFLLVWGISLAAVLRELVRYARQWLAGNSLVPVTAQTAGRVAVVAVALLVTWVTLLTPGTEMAVRMALDREGRIPRYWFGFVTSWEAAQNELRELVADADVFLTSQGHHAIYYLGDFDVEISATGLSDFQSDSNDSNIDPRTGRPVIADVRGLEQYVLCRRSGLVAIDEKHWRNEIGVSVELADFIEANLERVEITPEARMIVYRWVEGDERLDAQRRRWQQAGVGCPR